MAMGKRCFYTMLVWIHLMSRATASYLIPRGVLAHGKRLQTQMCLMVLKAYIVPPVECPQVKVEWQLTSPFDPTADVEGEEGAAEEYARGLVKEVMRMASCRS